MSNWVRSGIIQALRHGYDSKDEQNSIEQQATAIMDLVARVCNEADTFHNLIGYLNELRLSQEDKQDV